MGQTGISSLKLKKVREEGSLSPLTGTNWFEMLALKSEPGLHELFLIPVGKKKYRWLKRHCSNWVQVQEDNTSGRKKKNQDFP